MSTKDMLGPLPRALVGVPNNRQGIILDIANRLNTDSESGEVFHGDLAKFVRSWKKTATTKPRILSLISAGQSIEIGEMDGRETLAKAKDVFTGYVDPDFKNYWGLDVAGKATAKTQVEVHEMVGDADFNGIFNSLERPLDELCLTQAQIKRFARDNRNWLRTDGFATVFLFKENGEFFVARVDVSGGRLRVFVRRFEDDDVWSAESRLRVVVPQQTLGV